MYSSCITIILQKIANRRVMTGLLSMMMAFSISLRADSEVFAFVPSSVFGEQSVFGFSATQAGQIAVDTGMAVDDTDVNQLSSYRQLQDSAAAGVSPTGIDAVNGRVYWGDFNGRIYASDYDGGNAGLLLGGREAIESITVFGSTMYWLEGNSSSNRNIFSANLDGTGITQITTSGGDFSNIVSNDIGIYYMGSNFRVFNREYASLMAEIQVFSNLSTNLEGIAVNNSLILLSDATTGRIWKTDADGSNVDNNFFDAPGLTRPTALDIVGDTVLFYEEVFGSNDLIAFNLSNPSDAPVPILDGTFFGPLSRSNYIAGAGVIPEPGHMATLLGLGAVWMAWRRRQS